MFGFAQWDSPISLLLEALLSVVIVAGFFILARRVNARAAADRERYLQSRGADRGPASSSSAPNAFSEAQSSTPEAENDTE